MQQIKLMSKFGLALIAVTAISIVMATHAYYIQAADAQAKLPNNSVSSATIVNGQVKTEDLADGAVTAEKIADGVIPDGGGTVTLNIHEVDGELLTLGPGVASTAIADCPDGEILIGGGFVANPPIHILLDKQHPNGDNAWAVTGHNEASTDRDMRAFAYCLDPTIP